MTNALIVKQCVGCGKVVQEAWEGTGALLDVCPVYPNPAAFWNRGGCYFNTRVAVKEAPKKRVGQQKHQKTI